MGHIVNGSVHIFIFQMKRFQETSRKGPRLI